MGFGRVGRRGGFGRLGADFLRGGSIIAPPPPWTPAATSTALWLDAADASTFTFSSGSSVSQWSDKSGLGRNFSQGTVSSQPTRNVGLLNGLPGVTFNLQYLLAASASQVISNSFNLFVVASNDATRTDNNGMFVFYGPSTPDFSSPTTGVLMERMTIAWSYCLGIFGALAIVIDEAADLSGDPVLRDEISVAIGDPRTTGRVLLAISLVTIIARLRTLWRRS